MKLTVLLSLLAIFSAQATLTAQQLTISGKNLSLHHIFSSIKKQTGYVVFNNKRDLEGTKPVTITAINLPLTEALDIIFKDQPLKYVIRGKTIFVSRKPAAQQPEPTPEISQNAIQLIPIKIRVTDSSGIPLSGATVTIKKNKVSKVTDSEGYVTIDANAGDIVEITYIGHATRSVKLSPNTTTLNITLQRAEQQYKEVVINAGIITRKKESFTGAVSSFTGQELRKVGNGNVLQSLKSLDPSFIINPSLLNGSNPNQLPNIQLRGTTAITTSSALRGSFDVDPNQPLFILNGMESTLEQIVNLDINRIASITILKDAASTALYGSRAANGVVVVETKRPRPGDLRVNYTLDLRAEIPDLSDYNMMNAAEFLEFQKMAGYYDIGDRQNSQLRQDTLYNRRLRTVLSGVNTYWLNVPLRNALTAGHNININGGSEEFQYDVMLSYRNTAGVMKGSGRESWGASIDLAYRKKNVNFLNRVYVEGSKAKESPYGSFSDYVNMAPFYPKQNANGNLFTGKYLETFTGPYYYLSFTERKTPNPIYNSTLNPKNENNLFRIQNNLSMIWDIRRDWRFTAGLQVVAESGDRIAFVSAADTRFDAVPIEQKGTYDYGRLKNWEYQGNAMITYQRVFREKHSLTGNLRTEVIERNKRDLGFTAVGFPDGVDPNPAFASGYAINSKPAYAEVKARQVNALSSINYSYNNKYYADATFRMDGSTVFGSQKKYESFWAVGLGWTVNREKFLENANWISLLRLRANIGTNGNQQLGTFVSS
ncbi:MAG: SusC/RagA family TonB-linked outer membrane protein, partial [Pseudobacter sp.]|uniref:SusC/RagA family TonB-linked outer membrane protein n=1 Tax=Pseudobacter sp. TaxID=2045420 RepID=UPI003F81BDA4